MDKASIAPRLPVAENRGSLAAASTWLMAARPRTLGLSMSPVLVGAALASAAHAQLQWPTFAAALAASMCIQLGTNLHNDAVDSERGGDEPDRLGPPRVTGMGLLNARSVKRAAAMCFGVAFLLGLHLVAVGGRPILLLGVLSIIAGWAYNGGPWPIAYTPFGELFVVAFFGLGAVGGTYWLFTGALDAPALLTGLGLGLIASAVLLVNNFRDREADARVGRSTLAMLAGTTWTRVAYAAFMLAPFALLLPISRALPEATLWPALLALPPALVAIHRFVNTAPGRALNAILVRTVQIQVLYSVLLATGLLA